MKFTDYHPPKRIEKLENDIHQLETLNSKLNSQKRTDSYTGIINPIYDIKMPKDKFRVKRSKSLGRSLSNKSLGLDMSKYNLTLGRRNGAKTNDVVTALTGMSGETGVDAKSNFFQRYATAEVVGDSYKASRVTID